MSRKKEKQDNIKGIIIGPSGAGKSLWLSSLVAASKRFRYERDRFSMHVEAEPGNSASSSYSEGFFNALNSSMMATGEVLDLSYKIKILTEFSHFKKLPRFFPGNIAKRVFSQAELEFADGQGKTFFHGNVSDSEFKELGDHFVQSDFALIVLNSDATNYFENLTTFSEKMEKFESLYPNNPNCLKRVAILLNQVDKRRSIRNCHFSPYEALGNPAEEIQKNFHVQLERLKAILSRKSKVETVVSYASVYGFKKTENGIRGNTRVLKGENSLIVLEDRHCWEPFMVIEPLVFLLTGKLMPGLFYL